VWKGFPRGKIGIIFFCVYIFTWREWEVGTVAVAQQGVRLSRSFPTHLIRSGYVGSGSNLFWIGNENLLKTYSGMKLQAINFIRLGYVICVLQY
jgi:hypothetical protein